MIKFIRETTADKVNLPPILIKPDMEKYSDWGYEEHLEWVNDWTSLDIPNGSILATNEDISEVWLLEEDHYQSKCYLIFSEQEYCDV